MPYTDQWPPTPEATPPDTELANLLANNIRVLEREIRERMDDQFADASGLWAASGPASPIVPSAKITGKDASRQRIIHYSKFLLIPTFYNNAGLSTTFQVISGAGGSLPFSDLYLTLTTVVVSLQALGSAIPNAVLYAPIEFSQPAAGTAVTVSSIDMLCDPQSLGAISAQFQKNTYVAAPATTVIGTATSTNTTGIAIFASGAINYTIVQNEDYYIKLVMPLSSGFPASSGRVYGVRLNLSVPFDARANIA